jgi:hypothetical protein
MPFQQPIEFEGPEVDVPHSMINLLEPDVLAGTADGDVDPLAIPPNTPVGTDVAAFETVRILKWRRLRSYHWRQWGRRGYRELRKRGVGRQLAWNTVKSAHGPWRLSQSPALAIALPQRYFAALGLPSLVEA